MKKKNKKLNKFESFFDITWFLYDFAKVTGFLFALIFLRMKNIYIDKKEKKEFKRNPCVIASNHASFIDPLVMLSNFSFKRVAIVATKDLFEGKFKHFLFTYVFKSVCVDKDNVSIQTFKKVNESINRGHSVVIFPEGTVIHKQDGVEPFKPGVILMAAMSKAPIYPIYIIERKHWYERQKVIIGRKFNIKDYTVRNNPTSEELNICTQKLYEKVLELEAFAKQNYKKEK